MVTLGTIAVLHSSLGDPLSGKLGFNTYHKSHYSTADDFIAFGVCRKPKVLVIVLSNFL